MTKVSIILFFKGLFDGENEVRDVNNAFNCPVLILFP